MKHQQYQEVLYDENAPKGSERLMSSQVDDVIMDTETFKKIYFN